jgi:hypothetical protein
MSVHRNEVYEAIGRQKAESQAGTAEGIRLRIDELRRQISELEAKL